MNGEYGQINSATKDLRIGLTQSFSFPSVYINQKRSLQENYLVADLKRQVTELDIKTNVRSLFYELVYLQEKRKLLLYADSIYQLFENKTNLRFKVGETDILEKTTASSHRQEIANQLRMLQGDMTIRLTRFNMWLGKEQAFLPQVDQPDIRLAFPRAIAAPEGILQVQVLDHDAEAARWRWRTERSKLLPDFFIGYNNQSIAGSQIINGQETYVPTSKRFSYVNAGISVPLFFGAQSARTSAAKVEWQLAQKRRDYALQQTRMEQEALLLEVKKYALSLDYYEQTGLENANVIIGTADKQFTGGEINYLQWVILVDQAINIKSEYLDMLNSYNQSVLQAQKINNL
jgi:cobalt-zinc-cadmium resistance protein CzcA